MTSTYQDVLFFVFVGFFILIGLTSLSALLGFPKTVDKRLQKWALRGFIAGVTTAVFGLFRILFLTPPSATSAPQVVLAPINVTLAAAPEMSAGTVLTRGKFMYDEQADEKRVLTQEGDIVPVRGVGTSWTVKLPGKVADKPTQLYLQDESGGSWQVERFYPNSLNLQMKPGKPLPTKPVPTAAAPSWQPFRMTAVSAAELSSVANQEQATIKFNNSSKSIGDRDGRPSYEWRVYVDEPPQVLQTIARVD